jgi:hypothetical protein
MTCKVLDFMRQCIGGGHGCPVYQHRNEPYLVSWCSRNLKPYSILRVDQLFLSVSVGQPIPSNNHDEHVARSNYAFYCGEYIFTGLDTRSIDEHSHVVEGQSKPVGQAPCLTRRVSATVAD